MARKTEVGISTDHLPESEINKMDYPEVEEQEMEKDPEVFISARCHSVFTLPISVEGK